MCVCVCVCVPVCLCLFVSVCVGGGGGGELKRGGKNPRLHLVESYLASVIHHRGMLLSMLQHIP